MGIPAEFQQPGGTPPLALITGAARRIGAAFAESLAADGFRVAIHCHRSRPAADALAAHLAQQGYPPPLVVEADLAADDADATIFARLPAAPVLLVNNASLFHEDTADAVDCGLFSAAMAVNARAPVLLSARLAAQLPAGGKALIVNILDSKLSAPNADFFSYSLSKYALAGATELAARAFAGRGIRVNAIAPAITLPSGRQSAANFARTHGMNPLGRGVSPEDLVSALRFLVQTPTITGQVLTIDSGQRFLALPRDVAYMAAP